MINNKTFEEIYNTYKIDSNKENEIEINGKKFYKIIHKDKVNNFSIISIPNGLYYNSKRVYEDENGKEIIVGVPIHYSFKETPPQWYFEIVQVLLENTTIEEIGEYLVIK